MTPMPEQREDILVSICLSEVPANEESREQVLRLAGLLRGAFRYWEIVLVVDHNLARHAEIRKLAARIENLRVMVVRATSGFYRMRNAAASEAIGDIVVLTCFSEIDSIDLRKLIAITADGSEAIVCTRSPSSGRSPVLSLLGRFSGHDINTSDMLTAAYPRMWLDRLLKRQDTDLALRFPPTSDNFPVRRMSVTGCQERCSDLRSTYRRITLLGDVMSNTAPRLLLSTAMLSLFVTGMGLLYAFYAVVVWCLKADVQPGWLSTSVVSGLTAAFLGCALAALTMGMFKILDRLNDGMRYTIIDEYSNVDLFGDVKALNVETTAAEPGTSSDHPATTDQKIA